MRGNFFHKRGLCVLLWPSIFGWNVKIRRVRKKSALQSTVVVKLGGGKFRRPGYEIPLEGQDLEVLQECRLKTDFWLLCRMLLTEVLLKLCLFVWLKFF